MRILFLGPPGSGKGTQCKKLSEKAGVPHLSSGDLLRAAIALGTKAGHDAKSYMDKGQLVPDPVLIEMFHDKMASPDTKNGYVLDGFPRNLAQAKKFDQMLQDLDSKFDAVINLKIDRDLLQERIAGRRTCTNKTCATVYHVKFSPPKKESICDRCGSELMQRSDDRAELVAERLKVYDNETAPLINYYDLQGILKTVDGDGEPEEIFNKILQVVPIGQTQK